MKHLSFVLAFALFITNSNGDFYRLKLSGKIPFFNNRPVIGILAQETSQELSKFGQSYISASYVKFVEAGGGRPVAIRIKQPVDYYVELFQKINGIIFPGGNVDPITSGYGRATKILYSLAVQENDNGSYFPLWGTCLGFEALSILTSGKNWLSACEAEDVALPLSLSEDYMTSRLFKNLPKEVYLAMTTKPVTINYHQFCLTPKNFSESKLDLFYHALSSNQDLKNKTFISTFEAFNYPFYGTQWHPEISNFEDSDTRKVYHSLDAVRVAQYMTNFFIEEARHSSHKFKNQSEENDALIYNINPVFTEKMGFDDTQMYFFLSEMDNELLPFL